MKQLVLALFICLVVDGMLFAKSTHHYASSFDQADSNFFDGNNIFSWMEADGLLISHRVTDRGGMVWPNINGGTVGYSSGMGITGIVNGDIRTAWTEYSTEFAAGPVPVGSRAADSSVARIFKINHDGTGDLQCWPWQYSAPIVKTKAGQDSLDQNGQRIPLLLGDQTLWMVINDADRQRHWFSEPLGIEIQITVWGYDDVPPWSDMMFVKWEIFNKSENVIDDAYVTLFLDYDIGDASNNRAGCDSTLSLGYGYAQTLDHIFYPAPPGFGFVLLQGPLVLSPGENGLLFGKRRQDFKNLPMTSFIGSG